MPETSRAQRVGQGRRPRVKRPWPRLPRWFVAGVAATSVAILVVLAVGISKLARPDQPLEERRSPSGAVALRLGGQASGTAPGSHDVASLEFRSRLTRPVRCGAVSGLQVAASTEQDVETLVDVVENGVCKGLREVVARPAAGETAEQRVVKAARKGTVIGFAAFEKTGEDSTTLAGSPPRVAVNARYSNRGKSFKGYLAVVVLHELMHAGADDVAVTAAQEYDARAVELERCKSLAVEAQGRSCSEAETIVGWGRDGAVQRLRATGFP